jgi:hypothetical protein
MVEALDLHSELKVGFCASVVEEGKSPVAPVSPSPTKDAFSIGDSNRNWK